MQRFFDSTSLRKAPPDFMNRMTWLIFYLTLYQLHVQKLAPLAKR